MAPKLNGIDHVHVYVSKWDEAEAWYADTLGFRRVEALESWAVKGGPLTLEDPDSTVHLALFERDGHGGSSAVAFGASGAFGASAAVPGVPRRNGPPDSCLQLATAVTRGGRDSRGFRRESHGRRLRQNPDLELDC